MQHNCRYVTGSEENEPDYAWNKKMHGLFKRMLKYRRELGEEPIDEKTVKKFEDEYDLILALAEEEYANEPPNEYYREGYNLLSVKLDGGSSGTLYGGVFCLGTRGFQII